MIRRDSLSCRHRLFDPLSPADRGRPFQFSRRPSLGERPLDPQCFERRAEAEGAGVEGLLWRLQEEATKRPVGRFESPIVLDGHF